MPDNGYGSPDHIGKNQHLSVGCHSVTKERGLLQPLDLSRSSLTQHAGDYFCVRYRHVGTLTPSCRTSLFPFEGLPLIVSTPLSPFPLLPSFSPGKSLRLFFIPFRVPRYSLLLHFPLRLGAWLRIFGLPSRLVSFSAVPM